MLNITPIKYNNGLSNSTLTVLLVENKSEILETYELPENYLCCGAIEGSIQTADQVLDRLFYSSQVSVTSIQVNPNTKFAVYLKE